MILSKNTITFETAIARLEEIADILERGEAGLAETMELFKEAKSLSTFCSTALSEAEEKLQVLVKEDDRFELDFEDQ